LRGEHTRPKTKRREKPQKWAESGSIQLGVCEMA
jgi:hypothetical protein